MNSIDALRKMAYRAAQQRTPEHMPITQNTPLIAPELTPIEGAINELSAAAAFANKIQRQLELKESVTNLYAVSKPAAKLCTYVNELVFLPIVHSKERAVSDVFAVGGEATFADSILSAFSTGDYSLVATYDLGGNDNFNAIKLTVNDVLLESIITSPDNVNWQYIGYRYYTDTQLHHRPLYQMIGKDTYIVLPNSTARYVRLTFRQHANERIEVNATFSKQHYEVEGEITFGPIPIQEIMQGKVHLLVDYLVPTAFDDAIEYVQFYVSADGEQFVRCRANIEEGYHGAQINPAHPLLTSASSLRSEGDVDEIFVKCVLSRPVDDNYSTPLIRQVIPYVE